MPVCEKHGEFYKTFCNSCNQELIRLAKESARAAKKKQNVFGRTYKVSQKSADRQKIKDKLQEAWRRVIYPFYEKKGLTSFCWITGNRLFKQKGVNRLWNPHVSHYYAKSKIWQLWCDPVNSGICSYDTNINNQSTVAEMEPMMIKVWGKERVDELKRKRDIYDLRIKTGQDPRFPPIDWMLSMIEECKKMKIE